MVWVDLLRAIAIVGQDPESWGQKDPEGYPCGPACYDCFDLAAVIRPGEDAEDLLKGQEPTSAGPDPHQ